MFLHWIRKYSRFQCNNFPLHRNEIFWFATNQNILLMCPKKALIRMNQPQPCRWYFMWILCVSKSQGNGLYWPPILSWFVGPPVHQCNPFDSQWCLYEWWKWIFSLGHIHNCLSLILFSTVCLEPGCSESWIIDWLLTRRLLWMLGRRLIWKLGCLDATDITLPCPSDGLGDGLIFRCLETQSVGSEGNCAWTVCWCLRCKNQ